MKNTEKLHDQIRNFADTVAQLEQLRPQIGFHNVNESIIYATNELVGKLNTQPPQQPAVVQCLTERPISERQLTAPILAALIVRDEPWSIDIVQKIQAGYPIEAIKLVRAAKGLGLREAKDVVDAYRMLIAGATEIPF